MSDYILHMNDGTVLCHHGVKGMKWGQHLFGLRDMYRYGKASSQYNKAAKRSAKLEKKIASGKDSKRNINKLEREKQAADTLKKVANDYAENLSEKQMKTGENIYKAIVFGKKALKVAAIATAVGSGVKAGYEEYQDYKQKQDAKMERIREIRRHKEAAEERHQQQVREIDAQLRMEAAEQKARVMDAAKHAKDRRIERAARDYAFRKRRKGSYDPALATRAINRFLFDIGSDPVTFVQDYVKVGED